ncbi:MAG: sulfide/dihydroorotate dehydrogenase-like FAD/NAD-binding protein [Candidatus Omnitrophota bacterium]
MFTILEKTQLSSTIKKIKIKAPEISLKAKAGQFVVLVVDEKGERIPLTLADWDIASGTITLIFQEVGFTTKKLGTLNVGDSIQHLLGPLGKPADIEKFGTVVCIGGGVGIAEVYPLALAYKKAGNKVIAILGTRSKELVILENELKKFCDQVLVATDDGSYGQKGFVTDVLIQIITDKKNGLPQIDLVYAIGPVKMMKAVSELTRKYNIKTFVSLNPIMVDATGMCGSCRCKVAGKTVFGCVDGPEFNGHEVDFDELEKRLRLFEEQEKKIA